MWKFAVRNLLSRPARSALSLLGLTVAIAGMVGLFSVARGLEQTFDRSFKSIPGLIVMQAGAPIPLFSRLPKDWKPDIETVPGVHVVAPEIWLRANVVEGKAVNAPPRFLFGVDIASRRKLKKGVYTESIIAGRFLSADDAGLPKIVISKQIAEEHHKQLGDVMTVNDVEFTIVGIYHVGSLLLDIAIILDGDVLRSLGWFDAQAVSGFYVEPDGTRSNEEVIAAVKDLLRERTLTTTSPMSLLALAGLAQPSGPKKTESSGAGSWLLKAFSGGPVAPRQERRDARDDAEKEVAGAKSDSRNASATLDEPASSRESMPPVKKASPVEVRNASDFSDRFKELSEDLNVILGVLTGIGMTVAMLSIVNTMLMSVTERVIEFGVLKANGWTPLDVLKLITVESVTLGIGGGVLGSAIGWTATVLINSHWPDRVNLFASPGLLGFSIAFSAIVGLIGGLYPAIWAMRLSPMEAIRRG